MERIFFFSNDKKLAATINRIAEEMTELICCSYDELNENRCSYADAVIMHIDSNMVENGIFEPIIKVKGKLGHFIPILAIIDGGTPQDIFSALQIGIYDYVERTDNLQIYQKKIKDLILWSWYLNKYNPSNGRQ